jgi:hypothetical protein
LLAVTPFAVNTKLSGPVIDRSGEVTAAWWSCGAQGFGCSVGGVLGDVHGRFGKPQILARSPRLGTAQAIVANRAVAWSSCLDDSCSVTVASAKTDGRFERPQKLTGNGLLMVFTGDVHGNQLIVWRAKGGGVWAATRHGLGRFTPPHRLSTVSVAAVGAITGAFGPRGEAIVEWTLPGGGANAAVYRTAH